MSLILRGIKGEPLTYDELDNNFIYLDNKPSGTGPSGPTGPTGPAGSVGSVFLDWSAIGRQDAQGPFSVTQSEFITLPFDGQGVSRPAGSIIGTTASNGFGMKISTGGNGIGRAFKIMAAADIQGGNTKVLRLRLRVYERVDEFSSWSPTDILLSQSRATTGGPAAGGFANLFTEWIYIPSNNEEEVVVTAANFTDATELTIVRIKLVITDLGPAI